MKTKRKNLKLCLSNLNSKQMQLPALELEAPRATLLSLLSVHVKSPKSISLAKVALSRSSRVLRIPASIK